MQPQFGSSQSDWETAKNNISQYMNQMIIQGEAASKEQQRKANEKRNSLGAASVGGDPLHIEEKSPEETSPNQPSTSSGQVPKQDTCEG